MRAKCVFELTRFDTAGLSGLLQGKTLGFLCFYLPSSIGALQFSVV